MTEEPRSKLIKDQSSWALAQKFSEESIEELCVRLNTKTEVLNPEPQNLLPGPVTFAQIRSIVPDIEAFKVLSTAIWPMVSEALERGDMQSVNSNIKALVAGGCLTKETAGAIAKLFVGKVPDPTWPKTVWLSPAQIARQVVTLESLQAEVELQNSSLPIVELESLT